MVDCLDRQRHYQSHQEVLWDILLDSNAPLISETVVLQSAFYPFHDRATTSSTVACHVAALVNPLVLRFGFCFHLWSTGLLGNSHFNQKLPWYWQQHFLGSTSSPHGSFSGTTGTIFIWFIISPGYILLLTRPEFLWFHSWLKLGKTEMTDHFIASLIITSCSENWLLHHLCPTEVLHHFITARP